MAGIAKGKVNCYFMSLSASTDTRDSYVALYKFLTDLATAGYTELVSLQWGTAGTGMQLSDEGTANPGLNSFYVFRFLPSPQRTWSWYILVQWSYGATFGNAPGNPGLANNDNGTASNGTIGVACAIALTSLGADANPWAGTVLGDGTDTKAATVWAAPALGSLYVFPRSNNPGGAHNTNKENTTPYVWTPATAEKRYSFFADRDNLIITGSNAYDTVIWLYQGIYVPLEGLTPTVPFVQIGYHDNFLDPSVICGTITGASKGGGIFSPIDNSVRTVIYSSTGEDDTYKNQPNRQFSNRTQVENPIPVYIYESTTIDSYQGCLGFLDPIIKQTYGVPNHSTLDSKTRIILGYNSVNARKVTLPWDGVTIPLSNYTKSGVNY
jgi:hypothetical protein